MHKKKVRGYGHAPKDQSPDRVKVAKEAEPFEDLSKQAAGQDAAAPSGPLAGGRAHANDPGRPASRCVNYIIPELPTWLV